MARREKEAPADCQIATTRAGPSIDGTEQDRPKPRAGDAAARQCATMRASPPARQPPPSEKPGSKKNQPGIPPRDVARALPRVRPPSTPHPTRLELHAIPRPAGRATRSSAPSQPVQQPRPEAIASPQVGRKRGRAFFGRSSVIRVVAWCKVERRMPEPTPEGRDGAFDPTLYLPMKREAAASSSSSSFVLVLNWFEQLSGVRFKATLHPATQGLLFSLLHSGVSKEKVKSRIKVAHPTEYPTPATAPPGATRSSSRRYPESASALLLPGRTTPAWRANGPRSA